MRSITRPILRLSLGAAAAVGLLAWSGHETRLEASSHREAPLIADDPVADNTDVYAFRSPDDPTKVTIIANYIPFQLPQGGPNYYHFGENVRYEIHVKNKSTTTSRTASPLSAPTKTPRRTSTFGWVRRT
jgi:hypothetical protein